MPAMIFEQQIQIRASSTVVEQCFTDLELMHQWLNPLLACEPLGDRWSTEIGSRSRFLIRLPLWQPHLISEVCDRAPGLVVWRFTGFFQGQDRWECHPNAEGTLLHNQFAFTIPNALVAWGFRTFAQNFTKRDMEAQLRRLKQIAERRYQASGRL